MVQELSRGSEFAGYRIESLLGRGGMGVVYLATHERLDRLVALKLIAPERAADETFRRRFLRESKLAASIEHPHAVPLYEAGATDDGTVFIAMQYIEGTDLAALLEAERWLEPPRAARLLTQIAEALDEAHRRGLVHRDVKPANVLIGEVGEEEWAYLTDFGATKASAAGTDLTGTGEWLGTLGYASPEQIQGQPVDARSDVYALGCVLFEALTGQPPYERGDHVAKLFAHVNDPPPAVTDLAPDLPPELDRVIARALVKDPRERFPSAGDLARAAGAAIAGEPVPARERSVATGGARAGVATAEAPTRVLRRLWLRGVAGRARWRWAAAALVVLAAAVVALVVFPGDGEEPSVIAEIEVGGRPLGLAVAGGEVWVTDQSGEVVSRVDPETNRLTGEPIVVGSEPAGVKFGEGSLWVANSGADTVSRIDVADAEVIDEIPVGDRPAGIRAGEGAVWVANIDDDTVSRIDPRSKRVEEIEVGDAPAGIAVGEGGVWVANSKDGTVSRIAPDLEVVAEIEVGARPRGVAAGRDSIWVANALDGTVSWIDPDTSRVIGEPIDVGGAPAQVTIGENWVWVANERDSTVSRIDPESGEVVGDPIEVGARPRGIAVGEGSVWVANSAGGSITRIEP